MSGVGERVGDGLADGDADFVRPDPGRWRRVHAVSGKRTVRRSLFTINLAAMIDVVFLLLMYFLLSMDFDPAESALSSAVAGEVGEAAPEDPFALPVQPIVVRVWTVEGIGASGAGRGGVGVERSAGSFAVRTDSPLLQGLDGSVVGVGVDGALRTRLASLRGSVLALDQPFVIDPGDETDWEHALLVFNAVLEAGFETVRFTQPGGAGSGGRVESGVGVAG